MGKYNKTKTPSAPTAVNYMGEKAFVLSAKEELVSTVMTTFLQDSYYEKEKEIVDRIVGLIDKVDKKFAAKLAIYARNEGNLRSVTHLMSAYLARYISGTDWGKRFYNKIVVRPDDMSEILSCYNNINDKVAKHRIPNAIKRGFKAALENLDAYQIDKYKMNGREISLIDLVNIFHPKGTQKNEEAYKRLMSGEPLDDLYESKILEKEMSKAGQGNKTKEEVEKAKEEAIASVLSNVKGMPIMNLLRNLRNIILYAPNQVDVACEQLRIKDKILKSRLLPFRFATAYKEIESMQYDTREPKSSIVFESELEAAKLTRKDFDLLRKKVLDAIEDALEISCLNIPELEGNTAILVDHSGSCRGDIGGYSRVSAFSRTNSAVIGTLFGCMFAHRQKDVYIGLFGDKLISVAPNRNSRLLDFNTEAYNMGSRCGGSTEAGIYDFMRNVVKEKKKVDNVIVFSDCQIGSGSFTPWYGMSGSDRGDHFHELFKEFRKINPSATFFVCNLRQSGSTSVFDPKQRIVNIAGWSDKIFDVIKQNASGGWRKMIETIEAIEI